MYVPRGGNVFRSHPTDKNHIGFITTGHNRDNMRGFPAQLLYLILFFIVFLLNYSLNFIQTQMCAKHNQFSLQANTYASLKATPCGFSTLK